MEKVLWLEFKKVDDVLVEECVSFILEKLVTHYGRIDDGKDRAFLYTTGKRYFQEWFFDKSTKTIFIEDLLLENEKAIDRIPIMRDTDDGSETLEVIKSEAAARFQQLIQNTNNPNSILVVCAIMECVLTQTDYNSQLLSLFLFRKTKLKYDALYRTLKNLNLRLALTRMEWFEKIFKMYLQIEPCEMDGKVVTDWEKRAIEYFEKRHERFKSKNFEERHNRITQKNKIKSTPLQRIYWMRTYTGSNLEGDYYKAFQKSYRTFKSDKRVAFN